MENLIALSWSTDSFDSARRVQEMERIYLTALMRSSNPSACVFWESEAERPLLSKN